MHFSAFDYSLPSDLIAQSPSSPRDHCRLMVVDREKQSITHDVFYHLPEPLNPGDVLVLNKTKVIPARIRFTLENKPAELFLTRALNNTDWLALVHPGKRFKIGNKITLSSQITVEIIGQSSHGQRIIRFNADSEALRAFLQQAGEAPLPPYIENSTASFEDYQTVFAQKEGSVAAPTASLHFTPDLLHRISNRGIQIEFVTLHVGIGTFLPIRTQNIEEHRMHEEEYELDFFTAQRLTKAKHDGRRLVAVGTTTVRVLESAWKQHKIKQNKALSTNISTDHKMRRTWSSKESFYFQPGKSTTSLFIYPGYQWKVVDGLITNFHLPKSTLLVLVSAFGGYDLIRKAYQKAIAQRYRFYSFGDAMIIL